MQKLLKYPQLLLIEYWQYLPVVISAFLLGIPFLFTGKVLFWGTIILQFIPWRHYAWTVIQSGHLPLWNPLVGMGAPLLANYQSALLYPPNWILFILDSLGGVTWLAWGQGLLVVLHWCLAGVGMIRLLNWLGIGKLGQALGGVSFGLSSYLVSRASFLSINAAVAWLPWVILYSSILIKDIHLQGKPSRRSFIILSIILALQLLSGHAQTTWYTILLAFAWSGFWGYRFARVQSPLYRLKNIFFTIVRMWAWLAVSLIVAAMISAPQMLPTIEYLVQSQRSAAVDSNLAMNYSFWPWRLITLFAPGMFGNPATGDYWGYGNYWEDALYIGLLPIIIGLWALVYGRKAPKDPDDQNGMTMPSLILFLGAMIIVSMLLAFGNNTPIFPWLYRYFPSFDMFQAPTRISIWAIFSLTILASIGIEKIKRPIKKALYWTRLSTAGAFAITLGASLVWWFIKDVAPTFIKASALAGLMGMICGLILLWAPPSKDSEKQGKKTTGIIWKAVVLIFVCIDLIFSNWGLNPVIDHSIIHRLTQPIINPVGDSRFFIPAEAEYVLKFNEFMRFDTFSPSIGWDKLESIRLPNMSMLSGVPSANNFDPLLPASYSQWVDYLATEMESGNSEIYANMLNLMGVGIVEELDSASEALIQFQQLGNPQRARLVNCAIPVQNNEQAMKLIRENEIKGDEEVILEGLKTNQGKTCFSSSSVNNHSQIDIVAENPNHLVMQTQSEAPGWLVVSDVWYPGWVATVDGVRAPDYRANSLFRSVKVAGGNHIVEYIYRPISFYTGLTLSLLCILLLSLLRFLHGKN